METHSGVPGMIADEQVPATVLSGPEARLARPAGGLTEQEAERRLEQEGPNAVAQEQRNPWLALLSKFWAPVPWMLEVTVVLELILGKYVEGGVIGALLVFNALLSFLQENRAENALALLRQRLTVQARALRDGRWQLVPAERLVHGDVIHLRMGDIVPADVRISDGQVQMDQSALTGESAPVEGEAGSTAYAGAVVKRGEATGEIVATGARTYFGKTAELVRIARATGHLQQTIFSIVKYLVVADVTVVVAVVAYSLIASTVSWPQLLPFALILLVASVPVALPATFTLATALGASDLAGEGVLVTRLSAIEEAAAMDVLASDKTGTITQNHLSLASVAAYSPNSQRYVLQWAVMASDEATQDPLDTAILDAAREWQLPPAGELLSFTPFEPATKRSEALVRQADGTILRAVKGAPIAVAALTREPARLQEGAEALAAQGYRVLAVAVGDPAQPLEGVGLLALSDPPRGDAALLIRDLGELGVRVVMVTGDEASTAEAVAHQVGIQGPSCTADALHGDDQSEALQCNVFASVFPEDKYRLVQTLQGEGHTVGMTGDGVNDAPALKQAEVGVAVASATDVAKAAASLVLTFSGLGGIVAAVRTGREIHQRMLTYTLNKIIKTFQVALFLSLGLVLAHVFVVTPLLIVLLLFANDFITMSLATDRVVYASKPDHWQVGTLVAVALILAVPVLALSFASFYVAYYLLRLPLSQVQTLMFVVLVFSGQGTVYLVRERRRLWRSLPSRWMLLSTLGDVLIVSALAIGGLLMAPVPASLVLLALAAVILYLPLVDTLKVWVFGQFGVH